MAVSDYNATPGLNTSISGINIAEGCAPGNLNDAIRQMMADLKTFQGTTLPAAYQPLAAALTAWAAITRASGFDTFAATPSSANLRALLTDEVGTGAAYFVGGALGTPASGTLTNCTGLPFAGLAAAAVVTESEGISSNDNDTTLPTSAAVKAYVDSASSNFTYLSSQNTTSGTAFDFTGIPASQNEVVLDLTDVSLSGSDNLLVQLGTSGGPVTTGYGGSASVVAASSASSTNYTNGAGIRLGGAGFAATGRIRCERLSGNVWQISHLITYKTTVSGTANGCAIINLGAELTQVRLTRTGTDTFAAGSARVGYR